MYLCVMGHVFVCVLGVMYLCVRGHVFVCVLGVMYLCVSGIIFDSFYDFSIRFLNCFDSVVFFY